MRIIHKLSEGRVSPKSSIMTPYNAINCHGTIVLLALDVRFPGVQENIARVDGITWSQLAKTTKIE